MGGTRSEKVPGHPRDNFQESGQKLSGCTKYHKKIRILNFENALLFFLSDEIAWGVWEVSGARGKIKPRSDEIDPFSIRWTKQRRGVTLGAMARKKQNGWLDQISKKKKRGDLVVIPAPDVSPGGWLDDEARILLRLGAMRLLRCVAGVDDKGKDTGIDPKVSRDAILALSMLFDRVPDVLAFEIRSTGNGEGVTAAGRLTTADLLRPEGRELMKAAIQDIPEDLIKEAIGE
mgnify:CR=1 FL=1|tara:strand:+ start:34 stop:729 length:696 start_codon:yes stop_codon:yes gene_type:complete